MPFTITNTYPSPIVKDFLTFLDYCEKNPPNLTKTLDYLNQKTLWAINQQLDHPAQDVTPRSNQALNITFLADALLFCNRQSFSR